ncbi:hypothetical protein GUITHDRAFT_137322 [Guillardia theta CCMP2712]|uniref:Uncharacterized protein n=1 Tax=Guillardia theta (strain CCMP2712) TaxID=905079 RepID=L1JHC5_GUITC|nr:hypothetical protein GUITHDRAFT_137322 [Guillardia theta CCMP2712]EKX47539.1 hypothetical protein GUITHDRAFT_137322 [Guillardia theta CCMP2712]|eukprot:XP_005834519.1 hypothetical protein GUITHDRAFT_137322 [Guillardia theta CCMP2712]
MSHMNRFSRLFKRFPASLQCGFGQAKRHVHAEQVLVRSFSLGEQERKEATRSILPPQTYRSDLPSDLPPSHRKEVTGKPDEKPKRKLLKSFTTLKDLVQYLEPFSSGGAAGRRRGGGYGDVVRRAKVEVVQMVVLEKDSELSEDFKRQIHQFAGMVMRDIGEIKGKNLSWTLNALKLPVSHFENLQSISLCCNAFAHSINSRKISPNKLKVDARSIAVLCNAFAKMSPERDEVFESASQAIQAMSKRNVSMKLQDVRKLCHAFCHRLTYDQERDSALFCILFSVAKSELRSERKRSLKTNSTRCSSSCLLEHGDNVGCLPVDIALILQSLLRSQYNDLEMLEELKQTIDALSLSFPQHFDGMSIHVILNALVQFRVCDAKVLTAIGRCIIASNKTIRTWLDVATDLQIHSEIVDMIIEMAMEMISSNVASISNDDSHALVRAITERGADGPLIR